MKKVKKRTTHQMKQIKKIKNKDSFLKQMIGFRWQIAVVALFAIVAFVAVYFTFQTKAATAWPLKVSQNGRYLVDQNNKPFFYTADTAWTLVNKLTAASAKKLIDVRKEQGFNAIQASLSGFGRTIPGPQGTPFQNGDLTKPNEEYFKVVDEIVKYAESKDMVLVMTPFWLGDNGGKFGGTLPSDAEMQSYAAFLGNRYKNSGNIIWFVGGDDAADSNEAAIKLLGSALKAADPNHLITAHNDAKTFQYKNESWYSLYAFQWNANSPPYSYKDVDDGYNQTPIKPVFNMEPAYDPSTCCGTDKDTTPQKNRRSGWWSILSGAMGVVYGGPREAWNASEPLNLDALNRVPATHTANIQKILSVYPWEKLVPDNNKDSFTVVTGGRGTYDNDDFATAARASDGSLIVAYIPTGRTLTVDMSKLSGPATASWIDPTNAAKTDAGANLPNSGTKDFAPPSANAGGDSDFVLILTTGTTTISTVPNVSQPITSPPYVCLGPCVPSVSPGVSIVPSNAAPVPSEDPLDPDNPTDPDINPSTQPNPIDDGDNNQKPKGLFALILEFFRILLEFLLSLFR